MHAGTIQVDAGATQAFSFTPDATYVVDYYTVGGQTYSAAAGHTFSNVQASHSIEVNFKKDLGQPVTYTLTASATTGGSISPSGNVVVNQGSNRTFSIAAASGYQISEVVVDGASVGAPSSYTFTNVTANHTIAASFQPTGGGTCTAVTDGQAFPITNAYQKFCAAACASGTHHPALSGAGGTFQLKAKACGGSEQSLSGWWANLAGATGCREIEIQNNGGHPAVSIAFQCW